MKNLLLITTLGLLLAGCGKQAFKADDLYPGHWHAEDNEYSYTFVIPNTDTEGKWSRTNKSTSVSKNHSGKVLVSKKKVRIGFTGFKIDVQPREEQQIVTMTLDGVTYLRYYQLPPPITQLLKRDPRICRAGTGQGVISDFRRAFEKQVKKRFGLSAVESDDLQVSMPLDKSLEVIGLGVFDVAVHAAFALSAVGDIPQTDFVPQQQFFLFGVIGR